MELFPLFYFGNINYFRKLVRSENSEFSTGELFQKQSYRNRCEIYGANGKLNLTVPIIKPNGSKTLTKDIQISYDENWRTIHWKSIKSAYGKSAFFEHYADEIDQVLAKKFIFLHELNTEITQLCLKWLHFDNQFIINDIAKPKLEEISFSGTKNATENEIHLKYYQVFEDKSGYLPNLSVLDLLFNEGSNSQSIIFQ